MERQQRADRDSERFGDVLAAGLHQDMQRFGGRKALFLPRATAYLLPMTVDTVLEDDRWDEAGLGALADPAIAAALRHLGLDPGVHELALLGCDDTRIAALNSDFRGKPQPTNVLSWPSEDLSPDTEGGLPRSPVDPELGDIAIAFDTCRREAAEQGKPFDAHVTHLLVHGCLHLLGYDHMTEKDARRMERLEVEILATLGLPDPY